jgi:hypothetical protein
VSGLWLTSFMSCSSYMIWSWSIILWEFHWPKKLKVSLNQRSIFIEPKFIFLDLQNPWWQIPCSRICKKNALHSQYMHIQVCSFTNHIISYQFHSIQFNSIQLNSINHALQKTCIHVCFHTFYICNYEILHNMQLQK